MKDPNPDMEKDYYSILGASRTASQDEIEQLYKRLAMRHHPDRGGDADEMKAINEAYRVLGNTASRSAYNSRYQNIDNVFGGTHFAYDRHVAQLSLAQAFY